MRLLFLVLVFVLTIGALSAQITDNFDDGDFINNPTWAGDALFTVDAGQLRSNSPSQGTYYLSTPSTLSSNANWEFFTNLKFSTSGANYVEIYLMADNTDLTTVSNGYFVRIGDTADEVVFYKKEAGVNTKMISSVAGIVNSSSNNPFFIRVTRDATDLWTLFFDDGNLGTVINAGSITDNSLNISSHFGIKIVQSTALGPINNHFFDDIKAQEIVLDTTPPFLNTLEVSASNQVILTFNEDIDQASAETTTNYLLNNGAGSPTLAVLFSPNQVSLTFNNDFTNGDYTLEIYNIDDLNGNTLLSASKVFSVFIPDIPNLRDVIITELMADPSPPNDLPESEYVEIFNNSSKTFDLKNWTFSDATSSVPLPTHILQPQEYVILCAIGNVSQFQPFGDVIGLSSLPTLNNSGDDLSLHDDANNLVDRVYYSSSWYKDETKQDGGYSLELINPNNVCGGIENWSASNDTRGGTPGTINSVYDDTIGAALPELLEATALSALQVELLFSERLDSTSIEMSDFQIDQGIIISTVALLNDKITLNLNSPIAENQPYTATTSTISDCTGNLINGNNTKNFILIVNPPTELRDIIISEVMAIPSPPVDLPESEYVELYNNSDKTVTLKDWSFSDAVTSVKLPSYILQPQEYVILCHITNVSLLEQFGDVIGLSSFPTLNNSGDDLSLRDNANNLVDQVCYLSSWYKDETKQGGGYSLEIINPNNVCGGIENWSASNDTRGGTPGAINSVFDETIGAALPELIEARAISQNIVELIFSERLDSTSINEINFQIDQEIGVSNATMVNNIISLTLSSELIANQTYLVTVTSFSDCIGNVIDTNNTANFILIINPAITEKDIIINEIMANPSAETNSPNAEFIELYNRSNKTFNLKNWRFTDGSTTGVLPFYIFYPDEHVVLTRAIEVQKFDPTHEVLGLTSFPTLNNSGDALVFYSDTGVRVDTVNYDNTWYRSSIKDDGGYSLELIDPNNICADNENWIASEDDTGSTPGRANSVLSEMPDNIGPTLVSAFGISPDTVMLTFNEKLDQGTILNANYLLSGGLVLDHVIIEDLKRIKLVLASETSLSSGLSYTVKVANLTDCPGNLINESSNSASFQLIEKPSSGELLINEILFNPRPNGVDFVELYNNSTKFISLKNWKWANGTRGPDSIVVGTIKEMANMDVIIGPGEFRAFTSDNIILKDQYPRSEESNFIRMGSLPTYSDEQGIVILITDENEVFDFFEYSEDLHSPILSDNEGVSLERISFSQSTNAHNNWISATSGVGFATPGYANSQQKRTIISTKGAITIDPKIIIPDGSGQNNFATISYAFDQSDNVANVMIMDLYGREIKRVASNDFLGAEGFYTWDGSDENGNPVRIGYYIVYVEVFNLSGEVQKFKEKVVVGSRF
jgi:hypothetical protein